MEERKKQMDSIKEETKMPLLQRETNDADHHQDLFRIE